MYRLTISYFTITIIKCTEYINCLSIDSSIDNSKQLCNRELRAFPSFSLKNSTYIVLQIKILDSYLKIKYISCTHTNVRFEELFVMVLKP